MNGKNSLKIGVAFLRVLIGWHFLFEGIVKVYNPDWTAFGYLATAQGPFKGIFKVMISDSVIPWVDNLNIIALLLVGFTLTLGIFERVGAIAGIALLALYFLAHPPLPGLTQLNVEGNYWLVNKNLIELAACIVIYQFPTGRYFGLERFRKHKELETETL